MTPSRPARRGTDEAFGHEPTQSIWFRRNSTLFAIRVSGYLRYMMFRDMSRREIPTWMGENAFATRLRFMRLVRTTARALPSIWNTTKKI